MLESYGATFDIVCGCWGELHLGAGGCGKTHYNCNDKGLVRTLFLAPSWKLARCKRNEIGINCSVWARALSTDPQKILYQRKCQRVDR